VDYTGKNRPSGGRDWSDTYHEIDIKDARTFWSDYLRTGLQFVESHAAIYIWHASKRFDVLKACLDSLELLCHQQIIWVKPSPLASFNFYQWQHEPCVLVWQKGFKPKFTCVAHKTTSVWKRDLVKSGDPTSPDYYSDVWELDWEGKKRVGKPIHPTQKPTEVFAIPMRVHTNEGDICYEPFSGSGTQIIAAERLHRRCFAMEIEPVFCDVAVKRWEDFTGKKAELLAK
jgi:DNA modification methylase